VWSGERSSHLSAVPCGTKFTIRKGQSPRISKRKNHPGWVHARKLPAHRSNTAPILRFELKLTIGNAARSAVWIWDNQAQSSYPPIRRLLHALLVVCSKGNSTAYGGFTVRPFIPACLRLYRSWLFQPHRSKDFPTSREAAGLFIYVSNLRRPFEMVFAIDADTFISVFFFYLKVARDTHKYVHSNNGTILFPRTGHRSTYW
jgi:hypothetical protein